MGRILPVEVPSESHVARTPPLSARGLHKRFGRHPALAGVDLELARGETVGLLGPNGAGKTTALRILCGLLRPDGGTVRVEGQDPTSRRARAAIGVAPQELAIYPELSPRENLAFFGRMEGLFGRALRDRVDAALEFAGLEREAERRAATLSGGMQRRLNLACAVLHEPSVLLLDEATAGVDAASRHHILRSLRALRARGTSILYSTHYLEEVEQLCDRAIILERGRVLAEGPVRELIGSHGPPRARDVEARSRPAAPDRAGLESVFLRLMGHAGSEP